MSLEEILAIVAEIKAGCQAVRHEADAHEEARTLALLVIKDCNKILLGETA